MVKLLLQEKSDPNMLDNFGWTGLAYAIKAEDHKMMKILLINHASPWSTRLMNYNQLCDKKYRCKVLIKIAR